MTRLMHEGVSWSGRERDCIFLNTGGGKFADVSAISGIDDDGDGRALAVSDWDGDGDLDLFLKSRTGPQLRFWRNDSPKGNFLALRLAGKTCNRDAIGALVEVHTGGRKIPRIVTAGDGYLSQSSKWLHFGLGSAEAVERVVIHWPGGDVQEAQGLAAGGRYVVEQGSDTPRPLPTRAVNIKPGSVTPPPSDGRTRLVLKTPLPLPTAVTTDLYPTATPDRVRLINLWAQWCVPCVGELTTFAEQAGRLREAGIDLLALNMDKPSDRPRADALFAEKIAPRMSGEPFAVALASEETKAALEAIIGHVREDRTEIPIPLSLLVDRHGVLQIIYVGPVQVEQLLADAAAYGMHPEQSHPRSGHTGIWYYRSNRNYNSLAKELKKAGRIDCADFYLGLAAEVGAAQP